MEMEILSCNVRIGIYCFRTSLAQLEFLSLNVSRNGIFVFERPYWNLLSLNVLGTIGIFVFERQ